MKYLKKFENLYSDEFLQRDESIQELKKGDKVVYNDSSSEKLKYGQTYIITGVFDDEEEVDTVKNGFYISVKDLNGKHITYKTDNNQSMWIYPKRFISPLKFETNKYNL